MKYVSWLIVLLFLHSCMHPQEYKKSQEQNYRRIIKRQKYEQKNMHKMDRPSFPGQGRCYDDDDGSLYKKMECEY